MFPEFLVDGRDEPFTGPAAHGLLRRSALPALDRRRQLSDRWHEAPASMIHVLYISCTYIYTIDCTCMS